jgi:NADPH:quinone reductase-like Zn-dependent oxidoreductase
MLVAQGTGGVSMFVVQLAKAAGATVIVTTSSDDKAAIARSWGADHVVNYRTDPEWQVPVRELTGGRGADLVVDVGGPATLARSIGAARMGGAIAIVGVLGGYGMAEIPFATVMMNLQHLFGVAVGSVADLSDTCRAIAASALVPHISHELEWDQMGEAMRILEAHEHVGKIAIRIP